MLMERYPTPNSSPGREGHRPRAVVLHTNAGSFSGTLRWFADPTSGVSAHYLIGTDGRVAMFVDETDTARHVGRVREPTASFLTDDDPNLYTIGIEFEDHGDPAGAPRTDRQYAVGAALLRSIVDRWEIPLNRDHVVGHREIFVAKNCPGNLDVDRLVEEATSLPALRAIR
ncbi:MAG TPA: peptidoglycan recognition family protein [Actinomycetota bacterium]|nr:peptidoglycan recognition family protein [Actinomycetota bacterium]